MIRYDAHIHAMNGPVVPKDLLSKMEKADLFGGCVFSNCPPEYDPKTGTSYEARMEEIAAWTQSCGDRLFPVLWIHPYEDGIIEKVRDAAKRGVCAFKIICNNFSVGEERCLTMLREIAALGKPVFFHSGILWDGQVSSVYNRPMNWEAVLPIEGLRFSLGHCSWPWIDECIALYGKFAAARWTSNTAEMFFDTTPGTPMIYREELLTKLYKIGYDVSRNVFFGTDSLAHEYDPDHVSAWLNHDGAILDKLEIGLAERENMYSRNLLRFLGKDE